MRPTGNILQASRLDCTTARCRSPSRGSRTYSLPQLRRAPLGYIPPTGLARPLPARLFWASGHANLFAHLISRRGGDDAFLILSDLSPTRLLRSRLKYGFRQLPQDQRGRRVRRCWGCHRRHWRGASRRARSIARDREVSYSTTMLRPGHTRC
jgi:hypothetical protein